MNEVIETAENGRFRVSLVTDTDAQSPRRDRDSNLAHVVTVPNRNYEDVDENGGPLQGGWDRIKDRYDAIKLFTRWARIFHGAVVMEHHPHEGPVSVWYLTPEGIAETTDPEECIRVEMQEFQNWLDGEVYGVVIEKAVDWDRRDADESMTTWKTVDDCWGNIGYEYAREAALEEFAPYKEEENHG